MLIILIYILSIFIFIVYIDSELSSASNDNNNKRINPLIETPIHENYSSFSDPSIFEDTLVFSGNGRSIFMYNISSQKMEVIIKKGVHPDIYQNLIVYQQGHFSIDADIYLYNLSTKEIVRITTNESQQVEPKIFGDIIVWTDMRNIFFDSDNLLGQFNHDIYMYNLSNSTEIQLTDEDATQDGPDIYNNLIVWMDWRNGPISELEFPFNGTTDIYIYNISEETEDELIINPRNQTSPKIWGSNIIWMENNSGKESIYLYDYLTGKEDIIINFEGSYLCWEIFKDRVVYIHQRNNDDNISVNLYNITTKQNYIIHIDSDYKFDCTIYNDYIAWAGPSHKAGIHIFDLSVDTDSDGIYNYKDIDDDNDGYTDMWEKEHGYDPLDPDSHPDSFFEKYWVYIGITVIILIVILAYLFRRKRKRSEQVGDGQRRNARLGEDEGKNHTAHENVYPKNDTQHN
jgi:beta propeller repeat protein